MSMENYIQLIANDLEFLTRNNISIHRALDILEATTKDNYKIIAINCFRESCAE